MTIRICISIAIIVVSHLAWANGPTDGTCEMKRLIETLGDGDDVASGEAMLQLESFGKKAIPLLVDALGSESDNRARNSALALAGIGKPAIPSIVTALKEGKSRQRAFAAIAFIYLKVEKKSIVPALCEALADADVNTRHSVMKALSYSNDMRAVAPLVKIVESKAPEKERLAALASLADLRELAGTVASQLLVKHNSVPNEELNNDWAVAIRKALASGGLKSIVVVKANLANKELNVEHRLKLFDVLDEMTQINNGDTLKIVVPTLTQLLKDDNSDVRVASVKILGRIGQSARPATGMVKEYTLSEMGKGRLAGAFALYCIDHSKKDDAIRVLTNALAEKSAPVRAIALRYLGEMKRDGAAAVADLVGALRDVDGDVRAEACAALGRIGRPATTTLAELRRVAKEDVDADVRAAAKRTLNVLSSYSNK